MRKRHVAWRLVLQAGLATRPCRGCSVPDYHDAHLTRLARLALRLP